MPSNLLFMKRLESSKVINGLVFIKRGIVGTWSFKKSNNFHKSPNLLP